MSTEFLSATRPVLSSPIGRTLRCAPVSLLLIIVLAACGNSSDNPRSTPTQVGEAGPQIESQGASPQATDAASSGNGATDEAIGKPTSAETFAPPPTSAPSNYDEDGDGYLNWDELQTAIRGTIDEYAFPADCQVTADLIIETMEQGSISSEDRWESQYQHSIFVAYYLCGWEHALMDAVAADDSEMRSEAIARLIDLTSETFIIDPSSRPAFLDRYERAQLGDYSSVIRHLENSCSTTPFITPESQ